MEYVLIAPAHNEEALIDKTLASMVAQTVLPERWVIVDDGSSDRLTRRPVLIDGFALLSGYCWGAIKRTERPVSAELMRFHRREQLKKLSTILRTLLKFKRVDSFRLLVDAGQSR